MRLHYFWRPTTLFLRTHYFRFLKYLRNYTNPLFSVDAHTYCTCCTWSIFNHTKISKNTKGAGQDILFAIKSLWTGVLWSHGQTMINCLRRNNLIAYLVNHKTPPFSLNSAITYLRCLFLILLALKSPCLLMAFACGTCPIRTFMASAVTKFSFAFLFFSLDKITLFSSNWYHRVDSYITFSWMPHLKVFCSF